MGTHLGACPGPLCSQSSAAPPAGSSCDGRPRRSVSPGPSAAAAAGGWPRGVAVCWDSSGEREKSPPPAVWGLLQSHPPSVGFQKSPGPWAQTPWRVTEHQVKVAPSGVPTSVGLGHQKAASSARISGLTPKNPWAPPHQFFTLS